MTHLPPEQPNHQRHHAHEGQVLILVAVASVILFAFAAMAIDVGLLLAERRGVQNAADAAALAVARSVLGQETNVSALEATAREYAAANGYEGDVSVDVDFANERVTVDVSHDVQRIFLGVFYDGDWSVSADAAAAIEPIQYDYALITLRENGPGVNMIGNVNIEIENGGAMSNSSMTCNGNGELHADLTVDSHLGFSETGNCNYIGDAGRNPNAPRIDDPMAGTPGPPEPSRPSGLPDGECNRSGNTVTCTPGHYDSTESHNGNLTIRFQPGTYLFENGGLDFKGNIRLDFQPGEYDFYMDNADMHIHGNSDVDMQAGDSSDVFFYFRDSSITFSGNTSLNMASGIYYFDGEDFGVSGNQRIRGDDVFLYFDDDASFSHAGNAGFDLTSSDTPLYPGMPPNLLFYAAPGSESVLDLRGNTGIYFDGITYMPDGRLDFRGNPGGVWAEGQVIVNEVEFRGNANGLIRYQNYVDIERPAVWLVE